MDADDILNKTMDMESSANQLSFPAASDSRLRDSYGSYDAFLTDLKAWSADTYQTFVIGRGNEKVQRDHHFATKLVYRKVTFVCIHHGQYESKGKRFRTFIHTRQKGCPANIYVTGSMKTGIVKVRIGEGHNQELLEEEWKLHPENRKLDSPEKWHVESLQQSHVPNKSILKQMRRQTAPLDSFIIT